MPGQDKTIRSPLNDPTFEPIDRHLARFLEGLCGGPQPELVLATALLGRAQRQGHVCLNLQELAGQSISAEADSDSLTWVCPEFERWRDRLRALPVVGQPGEFKPLVLDATGRLYFHRYWEYERRLAENLRERALRPAARGDENQLAGSFARLFGPPQPNAVNWQKVAAFAALSSHLMILSGGPGTGKTRTVVCLLALLLEQNPNLRIALAAPTGKAAARLKETIERTRGTLESPAFVRNLLPPEAVTVHRLLGSIADSPYFRHNAANPLDLDVLVLDEASMTDLALMAKLVDALPKTARFVVVGDKDQLAPVEAGHVLGDLCRAGEPNRFSAEFVRDCARLTGETLVHESAVSSAPLLLDRVVQLERNYRFGEHSAIHRVSQAVNTGDAAATSTAMGPPKQQTADLVWSELPRPEQLKDALREVVRREWRSLVVRQDPAASLACFNRFRILSAVRTGPWGVAQLNRLVEEILREAGVLKQRPPFYEGRPILITRNDYSLGVFNGDVGIVLGDEEGRNRRAAFLDAEGSLRWILPARLPEHETAFAMTVHKSQGSEFDRVLLILPDHDTPVLTRELLYTGVTRARTQVRLWLPARRLEAMIRRSIRRGSGLTDRLRHPELLS